MGDPHIETVIIGRPAHSSPPDGLFHLQHLSPLTLSLSLYTNNEPDKALSLSLSCRRTLYFVVFKKYLLSSFFFFFFSVFLVLWSWRDLFLLRFKWYEEANSLKSITARDKETERDIYSLFIVGKKKFWDGHYGWWKRSQPKRMQGNFLSPFIPISAEFVFFLLLFLYLLIIILIWVLLCLNLVHLQVFEI